MQNLMVSIIIPIFKVEPYIVRCIESVLHQTYRNLEVILVDDCTPDRSMELAKESIEKSPLSGDLTFRYLKHDYNRGLSAARNTGIDTATGEYVYFLDSDDEITENCIETLAEPLDNNKYDCVIGDIIAKGTKDPYFQVRGQGLYRGTEEIIQAYLREDWYPMAWNKLCRLSFLKDNSLYFEEGLIHEDELWSFQLACTLRTIYAVTRPTYIYYIRPNSITSANTTPQRIANYLKVLKGMYEFQEENHLLLKEVNDMELKFLKATFRWLQKEHHSLLSIYLKFRNADVRSLAIKREIYKTSKEKLMNFDLFLPSLLGFCFKYLLWKVRMLKRGVLIPFY